MSDAVWIALIAIVPASIVGFMPLLIKRMENKAKAKERAEDRAALAETARRVEEVAAQARETARDAAQMAEQAAVATRGLVASVDRVETVSTDIHTLVNSNLTLANAKALASKQRTRQVLIADMNKDKNANHAIEIAQLDDEIMELMVIQASRGEAQAVVDKKQS